MKAAIIAAGHGVRLVQGGITTPKPLVRICGDPMIARLIRAAAGVGASSLACIINERMPELESYLLENSWPLPLELVRRTTPSSMESLFALSHLLSDGPFLLFTADAVFAESTLSQFLHAATPLSGADGVLALTRFVDDESPLHVVIDRRRRVTAIGETASGSAYITAGFYYFKPTIFQMMDTARRQGLGALRRFLALLSSGGQHSLYGIPVSKTIDVDYPADIAAAEAYVRSVEGTKA